MRSCICMNMHFWSTCPRLRGANCVIKQRHFDVFASESASAKDIVLTNCCSVLVHSIFVTVMCAMLVRIVVAHLLRTSQNV